MIAVDTNVVVRLIASDDLAQRAKAEAFMEAGLFISHGVLMEVEWVLRSAYGLSRKAINEALRSLIRLQEVRTPKPLLVDWALDRHAAGADFADMLHLIASRGASLFLTFDQELIKHAGTGAPVSIELLQ